MEKNAPAWYEGAFTPRSYRSLFKWGDPMKYKHPNRGFIQYLVEKLEIGNRDLQRSEDLGVEEITQEFPITIDQETITDLEKIVGKVNLSTDTYARVKCSYGKSNLDSMRLRKKIIENLPDAVVYPRDRQDICELMSLSQERRIPIYVYGGGSSVTRGTEAVCGGISLDLSRHMNRLIEINEEDQTVTVQSGMQGPTLEMLLNQAPQKFGSEQAYTVGHFPQSFEFSSVGGWVVTRGAGQNSTFYGKIEDIVISQEYSTFDGFVRTGSQPKASIGPDIDQIMMGSEGAFGILTEVTLKIHKYQPENTRRFSYIFRTWQDARTACRMIMQGDFGYPSIFRLSDPEETDVALSMYNINGSIADQALKRLGYLPGQRCILIGSSDGNKQAARLIHSKASATCKKYHGFPLTFAGLTRRWEHSRFTDPYMREDLNDHGILIDTLECGVTWSQMESVHSTVRSFIKSHSRTVCMGHLSHAYPQGGNLYFIFILPMGTIRDYLEFQYGILETIQSSGASISHHHGIGKQTGPWLEGQIGKQNLDVIRALKQHFDPEYLLNPGGTLGLDLTPEQATKHWGMNLEV